MRPTGPRLYRLGQKPGRNEGGPGEPPVGFVTPHTSKTEWWVYWALAKVLNDPIDPRQPPFVGGRLWGYQKAEDGGRVPGGQVLDFVVLSGAKSIGIRVETERWHIFTDATQQQRDFFLHTHSKAVDQVVRIYDQDFIGDPSGKQVCAVVAEALKGQERLSPIRAGNAQRVRI